MRNGAANEGVLAEVIHGWLIRRLPGDERLVNEFTEVAMAYRTSGATIDETCEKVHQLVQDGLRHQPTASDDIYHLVGI
jgi:hypothetical protein